MAEERLKLIKNFIVYGLGNILIYAAGFFLIPLYTRYLSTSEFGILEILDRCVQIAGLIFGAGLWMASISFYSRENEQVRKNAVISTAVISVSLFSVVGWGIFLTLANPLNNYFFGGQQKLTLFRMAGLIICGELMASVPMAYIQARMESKLYILISFLNFSFRIIINIFTVILLKMGLTGVVLTNMLVNLAFAVVLIIFTLTKTGIKFDKVIFKDMLRFGLPFVPGGLLFFVFENGDRFFLQSYTDSSTVGIYSFGYKIGRIGALLVLSPFLKIWGPYMFKLDADSGGRDKFGKFFIYVVVAYCMIALPMALFSKEIIKTLSGESYWEAYKIVPLVLIAYLFWTTAAFFDSGFYITKKTAYKPFIMGTTTLLVILLYWILIPSYGMLGAAYATVISYIFYGVLTYLISSRIYPVDYPLGKFTFIFGLGVAIYTFDMLLHESNYIFNIVIKTVFAALYPIILIVAGVFDKKDISSAKLFIVIILKKIGGKSIVPAG